MGSDIKFDIEVTGIKELKDAAASFDRLGKISAKLSSQYKPLGAQTTRLVQETKRLAASKKQLEKAFEDGLIDDKQLNKAMAEQERLSKERILTDKTLIAQAKKRAKAAKELKQETARLVKEYAPARTAANLYQKKLKEIDQALHRNVISSNEAEKATATLKREFHEFTSGLATGGNQFSKFNVEAYRANQRTKRFASVGLQQAGYQVGDFAVQLQGGTNIAVAFGQQMSQLLGIFGAGGAIAGAGVAIATAFIAPLLESKKKVTELKQELELLKPIVDSVTTDFDTLSETFGSQSYEIKQLRIQLLGLQKDMAGADIGETIGGIAGRFQKRDLFTLKGQLEEMISILPFGRFAVGSYRDPEVLMKKMGLPKELGTGFLDGFNDALLAGDTDLATTLFQNIVDTVEDSETSFMGLTTEGKRLLLQLRSILETSIDLEQTFENLANFEGDETKAAALKKQAQAEVDLFEANAAYEKKMAKEVQKEKASQAALDAAGDQAILNALAKEEIELFKQNSDYVKKQKDLDAAGDLAILNNQAQAEVDLMAANAKYESDQNALRQKELDETNKKIIELAERLSIPFAQALGLIRQAKAEATVGLDAFGGPGDFKYSVPTKFRPSKGPKAPKDALVSLMQNLKLQKELLGVEEDRASVLKALGESRNKYTEEQIQRAVDLTEKIRLQTEALEQQKQVGDMIGQSFEDAFMSIVDGTKSVQDAFRLMASDIIKELYRIFVVKQITGMIATVAGDAAGLMSGSNPFAFDGGGYTGSGPRSGGLDGKGGFMAMLHPRETVVDHTKGQGVGGEVINVTQNINVSTGVQQTVRAEIKQLMPQIADSAKAAVVDAKRRGGSYGRAFS